MDPGGGHPGKMPEQNDGGHWTTIEAATLDDCRAELRANIRRLRRPDPYKGKGVRYEGEQIRRKVGKTGK